MQLHCREARQAELPVIAGLICRAFEGYPVFENAIAANKRSRTQFLYAIHELNVRTYMKAQHCYVCEVGGDIVAAALLKNPDKAAPGFWEYLKMGALPLLLRFPAASLGLLNLLERTTGPCLRYEGRVWFLDVLAVDPEMQGKGIGSFMLHECLAPHIARNGGGIMTLNTNIEKNRKFYEQNGFEEFLAERISGKAPISLDNWCYRSLVEEEKA